MKKQTAVEWLIDKHFGGIENCTPDFRKHIEQALEIENNNTLEVIRVEVIQHSEPYNGRAYTNYNAKEVEIQLQDDGKTLKIFLK